MSTETFTSTQSWTCPTGVTSVAAECWAGGAGGRGNNNNETYCSGGGGGAYSKTNTIAVTPGNSYTVTVGAAVGFDTNGNNSSFTGDSGQTCVAAGGKTWTGGYPTYMTGGLGGATANCTGDTKFAGGQGGSTVLGNYGGGGGGGGAGSGGGGGTGGSTNSATAGTVGAAGTPDGGQGGAGGTGGGAATNGQDGSAPGGGGGGAGTPSSGYKQAGGGARGQVKLTYTAATASNVITAIISMF